MFPSSYGLFGSILSTDGMLSRVNVYEIGIPKTGHVSGTWRRMNASLEMITACFLRPICRHSAASGFDMRSLFLASSNLYLLAALYLRMYSVTCARCLTPLALRWAVRRSLWHAKQVLLPRFQFGNWSAGFSTVHTRQVFMLLHIEKKVRPHFTELYAKSNYMARYAAAPLPPRHECRGFSGIQVKLFVSFLYVTSVVVGVAAIAELSPPVALVALGALGWVMFRKPKG